jgi:hypothetical protein
MSKLLPNYPPPGKRALSPGIKFNSICPFKVSVVCKNQIHSLMNADKMPGRSLTKLFFSSTINMFFDEKM